MSSKGIEGFGGRAWRVTALGMLFSVFAGCDAINSIGDLFDPPTTRVELRNNGDFAVNAVLYISDEQDIPRELLTEVGERIEVTIDPAETLMLSRDCDELQAIVVDEADLQVIGAVGPEADSEVLRDGDDFSCRDVIEFRFDHTSLILDFDVETNVRSG